MSNIGEGKKSGEGKKGHRLIFNVSVRMQKKAGKSQKRSNH